VGNQETLYGNGIMLTYAVYHFVGISQGLTISGTIHLKLNIRSSGTDPLLDNATERTIRPFVIGRNNWLSADTVEGAKASGNLYSLIETVKAHGLEPYRYLRHVFKKLLRAQSLEEIEQLLP